MKFHELDKRVQDRIRYAEPPHAWWDAIYEDAKTCAECLGITIATRTQNTPSGRTYEELKLWFSGFGSRGSGASFEGYWQFKPGICAAIAQHAPQDKELADIAQKLSLLQTVAALEADGKRLHAVIETRGNYCHSGTMRAEVTLDEGSECAPEKTGKEVLALMRRFADWIFDQLSKENDYLQSDECLGQYDFDEDGTII